MDPKRILYESSGNPFSGLDIDGKTMFRSHEKSQIHPVTKQHRISRLPFRGQRRGIGDERHFFSPQLAAAGIVEHIDACSDDSCLGR
jgi:hypothetical protein